jgi:anti-repressor protein
MTNVTLIPILPGNLDARTQYVVDARRLHGFLEVRRDFSNWIRARIDAYCFELNVDYLVVRAGAKARMFDPPTLANQTGRGGDRRCADYYLSLDTAKELAMIERTEQGRHARRYFIGCEEHLRQLQSAEFGARPASTLSLCRAELQALNRQAWGEVKGEVHAAFYRRRDALERERVQALTHQTVTGPRLLPPDYVPFWAKQEEST